MRQPLAFVAEIVRRYFKHDVGDSAAAMTYYLLFSFFPLVIMGSVLLGYANISTDMVNEALKSFLPRDVIDIVNQYVSYVTLNKSKNILMVSIFFTAYFPARAMSKIMNEINKVYRIEEERPIGKKIFLIAMFAVFFVFVVAISLIILVMGRTLLSHISLFINISTEFIDIWVVARFVAMAAICFVVITMLYVMAPNCKVRIKEVIPGAACAVFVWILGSIIFSYYVENIGKYSVLFGSIGAIIVLMLWIYMMVSILIMGAEVNSLLKVMGDEKQKHN